MDKSHDNMSKKDAPVLRRTVRGPSPQIFEAQGVEELLSMVMALTTELWVLRERVATLEALSDVSKEQIESYVFSAEERSELDETRRAYLERVFIALKEYAEASAAPATD